MMKRLAVAAAATALAMLPTAALAAGSGYYTTSNTTLLASGCFFHPYVTTLSLSSDVTDWILETRIIAPDGSVADLDVDFGEGGGERTLAEDTLLCSSSDKPGAYTISGKLTTYGPFTPTEEGIGAATFQVAAYVPPPAPPAVDVDGAATKLPAPDKRSLRFRLRAFPTPTGYVEGKPLVWKFKLDQRRAVKVTQEAGDSYTYSREFSPGSGLHKIVVWKNGVRERKFSIRLG